MDINEVKKDLEALAPEFAERVQPVYELLGWKWAPEGEVPHVPSVEEITWALKDLIGDLDSLRSEVGTGGLRVSVEPPTPFNLCGHANLSLVVHSGMIYGQEEKISSKSYPG